MNSIQCYPNTVLCYMYVYAGYSFSSNSFFNGGTWNLNAPIVLDNVSCDGTEATLSDSYTDVYGTYNPDCALAAGVMCEGNSIMVNFLHIM